MDSSESLKKIELVSPAGNNDQLVAAINAGADAVYLGFKKYSARAYADNFELKQLKKAVRTAHENSVKVYLALNTLIKDSEITEAIYFLNEYLGFNQDGIIIQDFGLLKIMMDLYPGMRLHASTQMNVHNLESVILLKEAGFKRVILAREMTLQEIINITKNCDIEIETFAHGSQCYSYSGSCYFSSFTGSRSGNRGRCTQPCRMKYDLALLEQEPSGYGKAGGDHLIKNAYILSKSDLFTLEIIPELAKAGITALKIEGRMKTPEYVGVVTQIYRKYLDLFYKDPGSYRVDKSDIDKIKQIFAREINSGYYEDCFPEKIISPKKSGSIGNFLGRITRFEKDHIYIKSSLTINKGDYLEIWTNRGNEQLKVSDFDITGGEKAAAVYKIKTDHKIRLNIGDRVFKFFDEMLDREAKDLYVHGIKRNKNLKEAEFALNYEKYSDLKLSSARINEYVKKTASLPEAYDNMLDSERNIEKENDEINLAVEVYSLKDARLVIDTGVKSIVINNIRELFYQQKANMEAIIKLIRLGELKKTDIIIKTPHIVYYSEIEKIKENLGSLFRNGINSLSVSNTGLLGVILDSGIHKRGAVNICLNFMLNIFNHKSAIFFEELIASGEGSSLKVIMPSAELTLEEITVLKKLSKPFKNNRGNCFQFYVYSYGYFPVMQSRFRMDYFYRGIADRNVNKAHQLIDQKGYRFIVLEDYNDNLIFLNSRKICNFFDLPAFYKNGINNIYIDTRMFDQVQIREIIGLYKSAAACISTGNLAGFDEISRLASKNFLFSNYTRGHFFREVI